VIMIWLLWEAEV